MFVAINKYLELSSSTSKTYLWKCKVEISKNLPTSDNIFTPTWIDCIAIPKVKFNENCLRLDNISFIHKNLATLNIIYKLDTWSRDLNTDFTLGNCLFEAVKLTTNDDPDKHDILIMVLDSMHVPNFHGQTVAGVEIVANFGVNISSSVHIDNNKKDILVPGEDPTQGLDDAKITAEAIINFTESGKRFVLSLAIMEVTVF